MARAEDAPRSDRRSYLAALGLLAATAAAVAGGAFLERQQREVAPIVRDYFAALQRRDLETALSHLAPEQRARWREFVANQQGNVFRVQDVSVRAASLLERLAQGQSGTATSATIFVSINPGTEDAWRATTLVGLERRDERWYLREPPLLPPEG